MTFDLTSSYVDLHLPRFVAESNAIEGIHRDPTSEEINATKVFLNLPRVTVDDLRVLVDVYAPGHVLRDRSDLNVFVGSYVAPGGGMSLVGRLGSLLADVNHRDGADPWRAHVAYEMLHPFTDGNGRSGRALWCWHMLKRSLDPFGLSFLHRFYYDTLRNNR
jgi:Fic/DOC family